MQREPITPSGHAKLVKEIDHLKHVERPNNIKAIEEARGHGDLSENADYDSAKQEQGMIQARLLSLEDRLSRCEVIDPKTLSGKVVMFGATVTLVDIEGDEELTYKILNAYEADAKQKLISLESPIGKALIGKEEGDEVVVNTPNGARNLAIVKVEFK